MITRHKTDNRATNCRFRPKSAQNGGPYRIESQHCGRHTNTHRIEQSIADSNFRIEQMLADIVARLP
jgi:hypothetical protein